METRLQISANIRQLHAAATPGPDRWAPHINEVTNPPDAAELHVPFDGCDITLGLTDHQVVFLWRILGNYVNDVRPDLISMAREPQPLFEGLRTVYTDHAGAIADWRGSE